MSGLAKIKKESKMKMAMVVFATVLLLGFAAMIPKLSHAVPGFARQTNMPCSACHNVFPELNSFGRLFKIHGYTLNSGEAVEATDANGKKTLELPKFPPLSAMIVGSFNSVSKDIPGTQRNFVDFPQEMSLFLSAKLAPEVGAFIQTTYEAESGTFGLDMVDLRYAHQMELASRVLLLGLSLNDNPAVQDVWNTGPVWSFPYMSSSIMPSPAASPLIDGGFEGTAVGFGPYFLLDNNIYGEISLYRSSFQGGPHPPDQDSEMAIKNFAPYWRVAYQRQLGLGNMEVGTYGMSAKMFPSGVSGMTDKYTDIAFDGQYERRLANSIISAHAIWIMEDQKLDATYADGGSQNQSNKLNKVKVDGNLYHGPHLGFSLGYFATFGDTDSTLYAPAEIDGSANGSPNSNGITAELDYLPWLNTKLSIQYTMYQKFNGGSDNYDGSGRKASDNNTIYISTWLAL